jgi:hypothetical protein
LINNSDFTALHLTTGKIEYFESGW